MVNDAAQSDEAIEDELGIQLEQAIKECNDELGLIPKMAEWQPWDVPADYTVRGVATSPLLTHSVPASLSALTECKAMVHWRKGPVSVTCRPALLGHTIRAKASQSLAGWLCLSLQLYCSSCASFAEKLERQAEIMMEEEAPEEVKA